MSHNIVDFQNSFLGNGFAKNPKSKTLETIDFTGVPKFLPEINQKWESQKCFWENEKSVFGKHFWRICVFGVVENRNKNIGGCLFYAKKRVQRKM